MSTSSTTTSSSPPATGADPQVDSDVKSAQQSIGAIEKLNGMANQVASNLQKFSDQYNRLNTALSQSRQSFNQVQMQVSGLTNQMKQMLSGTQFYSPELNEAKNLVLSTINGKLSNELQADDSIQGIQRAQESEAKAAEVGAIQSKRSLQGIQGNLQSEEAQLGSEENDMAYREQQDSNQYSADANSIAANGH